MIHRIKEKVKESLKKLSNEEIIRLEKIVQILNKSYSAYLERVRMENYVEQTDFDALNVKDWPPCYINRGEFDYPLFQICFLDNMIDNIIYCVSKGYKPIVNFIDSNGTNLWEQFLLQPYAETYMDQDEIVKNFKTTISSSQHMVVQKTMKHLILSQKKQNNMHSDGMWGGVECDVLHARIYRPAFPEKKDIDKWGGLYKKFVRFNKKTEQYFEDEYTLLIKGKRVLGVLCRGTDYVTNRPQGHPIQPSVQAVVNLVKEKFVELNCDAIYLATEEETIYKKFRNDFQNETILVNRRSYYDDFYNLREKYGDAARISWCHSERENDNYYKSLEYLSSINLLSKCVGLIAGCCGGSRAALYLNDNSYEYSYLFNLGLYP